MVDELTGPARGPAGEQSKRHKPKRGSGDEAVGSGRGPTPEIETATGRNKAGAVAFFWLQRAFSTRGSASSKSAMSGSGPVLTRMQRLSGATPGMRMKTPCSINPSTIERA